MLVFTLQNLIKHRGKQRTDSTEVLAAVRQLNRLELVGETLRAALNDIAQVAPEWLKSITSSDWFERYGRRLENYRLPKKKEEREKLGEQIGIDGNYLLDKISCASKEILDLRQL